MGDAPRSFEHPPSFACEPPAPVSVRLNRAEQELRITWHDGSESVYSGLLLRKNCPCATCRTEREKQSTELLPVLKQDPSQNVAMVNARLVGRYAVQLSFSDGHETGIFDFKYLRALHQAATGKGGRPKESG